MVAEPTGLPHILGTMRDSVKQYMDLVQQLAGENALALTVYGAIAESSFDIKRHTVRNVLMLDHVDLNLLRSLAEKGLKLGKSRISAPLIMTPDYIQASLDVFPLELIDIHQRHITIFGNDYFADLSFDAEHIRLQCERELKSILIGMRQGLLAAAGRQKIIGVIEVEVAERLVRTLRGMLWLKGYKESMSSDQVTEEISKIIDRPLLSLRQALNVTAQHDWMSFELLYQDVQHLGEVVNAW